MKKNKNSERKNLFYQNKIFILFFVLYLLILAVISSIACFYSYKQKQGELTSAMDIKLNQVSNEYDRLVNNFWQVYMPIFNSDKDSYTIMQTYFDPESNSDLSPFQKMDLTTTLSEMSTRSDKIQWIALVSANRDTNYIYYADFNVLQALTENFPYLEDVKNKKSTMEIYSTRYFTAPGIGSFEDIAICGGTGRGIGQGSLVFGYNTDGLQSITTSKLSSLPSLQYHIIQNGTSLFSTQNTIETFPLDTIKNNYITSSLDTSYYIRESSENVQNGIVFCTVAKGEFLSASYSTVLEIIIIVFILALLSLVLYSVILKLIEKEVLSIRNGLEILGENQLDYRITPNFKQPNFNRIAESINGMAENLTVSIERSYYYEKKQHNAELQELQSKFNPHFLYNSLEIFRARCYQNDDEETAELIAQTASIFRGFIGSRTFIPITEELAFSKRYLALFRARYGENVHILYDIDTDVLEYGIIRNVLQPLIENYFEHGIDPSRDDNFISFKGHIQDENIIIITEDNGFGIDDDTLSTLNKELHEPITNDNDSYGLKNLHQRLQLFYGEDYGIFLSRNSEKGMRVEMLIKKLPCEE